MPKAVPPRGSHGRLAVVVGRVGGRGRVDLAGAARGARALFEADL